MRLVWYLGWICGWFVLFSFIFVPLANLFSANSIGSPLAAGILGGIRGIVLACGGIVLFYGFRVIHRKLRATKLSDEDRGTRANIPVKEVGSAATSQRMDLRGSTSTPSSPPIQNVTTPAVLTVGRMTASSNPLPVMTSARNPVIRRAYAQAMKEVDTQTVDGGLWAMALVQSNGDERLARLEYMKARAADIAWMNAKASEVARERAEQAAAERRRSASLAPDEARRGSVDWDGIESLARAVLDDGGYQSAFRLARLLDYKPEATGQGIFSAAKVSVVVADASKREFADTNAFIRWVQETLARPIAGDSHGT